MRPDHHVEHAALIEARRQELSVVLKEILKPAEAFVWEVGCGHGHFLTAYAAAHPKTSCVGIDIASDRITRALRKRDRAALEHLRFIRAEAVDFLAALPGRCRFAAVFILFPDPWPKRRHHKNRTVTAKFMSSVAKASKKGTRLYFRTDHEPYFQEVEAIVRSHASWTSVSEPWPFEEPTVFEKRAAHHFSLVAERR